MRSRIVESYESYNNKVAMIKFGSTTKAGCILEHKRAVQLGSKESVRLTVNNGSTAY